MRWRPGPFSVQSEWIRVQANLVRDTMSIPTGELADSGPLVDVPSSSFWSRVVAADERGIRGRNCILRAFAQNRAGFVLAEVARLRQQP